MDQTVYILYRNWRDETRWRYVKPVRIWFGQTQYHQEKQWFLDAIDVERKVPRSFALKDVIRWSPGEPKL